MSLLPPRGLDASMPATLPLVRMAQPVASYELRFCAPVAGNYCWQSQLLRDDPGIDVPPGAVYDPAIGAWWVTKLVNEDTGELIGMPLSPASSGVQARNA